MSLNLRQSRLFEAAEPLFGPEVDSKFPQAAEDVEEAGKCLALSRYTAAVFHLMRAMEWAVQALSAKLQIGNLDREWGKLLSDVKQRIEEMPRGDDRDKWSETLSLLYHVKQAWRNRTMHPKQTYTSEEAERIYEAVRYFMSNLTTMI